MINVPLCQVFFAPTVWRTVCQAADIACPTPVCSAKFAYLRLLLFVSVICRRRFDTELARGPPSLAPPYSGSWFDLPVSCPLVPVRARPSPRIYPFTFNLKTYSYCYSFSSTASCPAMPVEKIKKIDQTGLDKLKHLIYAHINIVYIIHVCQLCQQGYCG